MSNSTISPQIYHDGKIWNERDEGIRFSNRGLLYGESIFTTLRSYNGVYLFLEDHVERLRKGCNFLWEGKFCGFEEKIKAGLCELSKKFGKGDLYFRVVFFLDPFESSFICPDGELDFYIFAKELGAYDVQSKGISILPAQKARTRGLMPAYLKSGNYLEGLLELRVARKQGFDDILFFTDNGYIAECATSNLFFREGNTIFTPSVECCILDGITRNRIINCLKLNNIKVVEGEFNLDQLKGASEVWVTSSVKGVRSVLRVGESSYKEEWTASLVEMFIRYIDEYAKNVAF